MELRMKTLLGVALVALLSQAMLGCKSTDQGATTGTATTRVADQVDLAGRQLESTITALKDLVEKPGDLPKQRSVFDAAFANLNATSTSLASNAAKMRTDSTQYFSEWNAQVQAMQNEDVRERSEDRRKAMEASFNKLDGQCQETRTALDKVVLDLKDIQTALKNDLTPSGIDALKPSVKKVDKAAASVSEALKELGAKAREIGDGMRQSGPHAATASA
jgi:chromosome segregation ATPase